MEFKVSAVFRSCSTFREKAMKENYHWEGRVGVTSGRAWQEKIEEVALGACSFTEWV